MSYILDALRKSEAERNQRAGGSLLNYPDSHRIAGIPVWIVVGVTLLVNVLALLLWTYWPEASVSDQATIQTNLVPRAPAPVSTSMDESLTTQVVEPVEMHLPVVEPPPRLSKPVPTKIVPFASLSRAERDAFPATEFSTHVYAEETEFRAIVANGTRLTEGEMLSENVQLVTITEEGAIFFYADQLVEIQVLQDWR